MIRRPVRHQQHLYTFCPDASPVPGNRMRGLVWIRVVDEITELPPEAGLTVRTPHRGLISRVSAGSIVGLVGNPMQLYPQLGKQGVDIDLCIAADRYVTRRIVRRLGPITDFPNEFRLPQASDEHLHRQAVSLCGRLIQVEGEKRIPLKRIVVSVAGMWNTFPPPEYDTQSTMDAPNLICLTPGFYSEYTKETGTLRRCDMVLTGGAGKTLAAPAPKGAKQIKLSDRTNLSTGDVLAIEPRHPDLAEFIRINDVNRALPEQQPAFVTLAYPVANDHREGAEAMRAELVQWGPENKLARDALPGDRPAFLNGLDGLADETVIDYESVVELNDGEQSEYHRMRRYETLSNQDGYFRLPPISRVAQLRLHAAVTGVPAPVEDDLVISPDYRYPENRFDIVFP